MVVGDNSTGSRGFRPGTFGARSPPKSMEAELVRDDLSKDEGSVPILEGSRNPAIPWSKERAEFWRSLGKRSLERVQAVKDRQVQRNLDHQGAVGELGRSEATQEEDSDGEEEDLRRWQANIAAQESQLQLLWERWRNQPYWDTKAVYRGGIRVEAE